MASSVVCSTDADDDWRKKNQSRVVIEKENRITFIGKRSFNANQSEPVLTEKNDSQVLEEQPIDRNRIVFFFFFFKSITKESRLLPCSVTRLLAGFLSGWKEKQRSKKKKYPSPKSKKESDSETRPGWNEREGYRDWESDGSRRPTGGRHTWTSKRASKREEKKKK